MKDVRDALFVAQRSDGTLVRRPMSPHIQVYRFQLSMFLSIANRVAGVISSLGTLLLVWWLVAAASGPGSFGTVQRVVGHPVGMIVLFGWTLALVFHFFSGLRHLAWDAGYGFGKDVFNRTGPMVVAATIVMTLLIWAIGFSLWTHGGPAPAPVAGS
jgi:succinate dehydrogenase / fumarate reductase cytochrome b subunit